MIRCYLGKLTTLALHKTNILQITFSYFTFIYFLILGVILRASSAMFSERQLVCLNGHRKAPRYKDWYLKQPVRKTETSDFNQHTVVIQ